MLFPKSTELSLITMIILNIIDIKLFLDPSSSYS